MKIYRQTIEKIGSLSKALKLTIRILLVIVSLAIGILGCSIMYKIVIDGPVVYEIPVSVVCILVGIVGVFLGTEMSLKEKENKSLKKQARKKMQGKK